ncbi:hypothetical protein [Deinococcus apachensis]|uniref:hypothetical protein n=1 Tax=Deinococcus apachensis TaxID=309886 RepID=UPI0003AA898A|nr:hypothetical protein [Deinococcus apachensis]
MSDRVLSALKGLGIEGTPTATLEREGAFFALLEGMLVYQDEQGTRRVTLRDLTRIHSDQAGLLRVETPAGTALTASLLGFDPGRVQAFFAGVRDATARAKNLPAAPLPTPGGPKTFGSASKSAASPKPAPGPSGGAPRDAAPVASPVREDQSPSREGTARSPEPRPAPERQEKVREVRVIAATPPPVTVSEAPVEKKPEPRTPSEVPSPTPAPAAPAPKPRALPPTLAERANVVSGLVSRLQLLAAVLGLAAVGLAVFQFLDGALLNGMWTLIAGGVSCIALLAFADVTRLIVALARAVAEGAKVDGRGP